MAYCYILDIELMPDKLQESDELLSKVVKIYKKNGAKVDLLQPQTGNVHRVLGIFHFETLNEYEELMKKAGSDPEYAAIEYQFHSMMLKPVYNLYSKVSF